VKENKLGAYAGESTSSLFAPVRENAVTVKDL
jgi:hypothetical protein